MAYVTNLGENANIGTHWIALYSSNNKITYFDNFGAEHMSNEIKEFVKRSTITTNSFRIQIYVSKCVDIIGVIRLTLKLSTRYFTKLFSPNNFKDDLKQY